MGGGGQKARMASIGDQQTHMFDPGDLSIDDIARRTADIWADLRFDRDTLARIRRDGLMLDGINLGGPSPFQFDSGVDGMVSVGAGSDDAAATLLDLWRLHFQRGLRSRPTGG